MSSSREELAAQIEEVQWSWVRPHLERDALITDDEDLDLASVAERISADDAQAVGAWISEGRLSKPSSGQVEAWGETPSPSFRMIIVQPYVLIQKMPFERDDKGA